MKGSAKRFPRLAIFVICALFLNALLTSGAESNYLAQENHPVRETRPPLLRKEGSQNCHFFLGQEPPLILAS